MGSVEPAIGVGDSQELEIVASAGRCIVCCVVLQEPYIRCAACPSEGVVLCPACFARGAEMGPHRSGHAYYVVSDRIPVLHPRWEARKELRLLDVIEECGYGNWNEIAMRMSRSAEECRSHYNKLYLRDPPEELRACLSEPPFVQTSLPYHKLRLPCENPPRLHSSMPGYNSLRSEFDVEHDLGQAERDLALGPIQPIEEAAEKKNPEEEQQLLDELQAAMVEVYNDRLRERTRRQRIVRDHGLLMARKTYAAATQYSATLGRALLESLAPFAQLMSGMQFDCFIEGLHLAKELQQRVARLKDLRMRGVRSMRSAMLMQRLSKQRAELKRTQRASNIPRAGVQQMDSVGGGGTRREAAPLEINNLPFCERLSPEERELCAKARIVPESFIEFKNLLMNECRRHNGLRLAQARKCIKIDVNKTRKLFDFLTEQGDIFPPS